MITLITGTPGSGKTAYAVSMLDEELRKGGRPVVVMGIPELVLPHEVAPPVAQWTRQEPAPEDETLIEAVFDFPERALVIIDEAQKVYRPRSVGSKVPDIVAAFEKHRHKALDFWLITQSPNLIDANVRKLVGKHVHLRSQWSGRTLYEWPETHDPESRTDRDVAVKRSYRLPARVFGLYKSATAHIKPSRRIPNAVWLLLACLIVGGWLGWRAYHKVAGAINGEGLNPDTAITQGVPGLPATSSAAQPRDRGGQDRKPSGAAVEDYIPRINTRPETAPMYDGIRQPKALPVVAGCVAMGERCTCYTEQATDAFLTGDQCREWLRHPPFNPWRDGGQGAKPTPVSTDRRAPGEPQYSRSPA